MHLFTDTRSSGPGLKMISVCNCAHVETAVISWIVSRKLTGLQLWALDKYCYTTSYHATTDFHSARPLPLEWQLQGRRQISM